MLPTISVLMVLLEALVMVVEVEDLLIPNLEWEIRVYQDQNLSGKVFLMFPV